MKQGSDHSQILGLDIGSLGRRHHIIAVESECHLPI